MTKNSNPNLTQKTFLSCSILNLIYNSKNIKLPLINHAVCGVILKVREAFFTLSTRKRTSNKEKKHLNQKVLFAIPLF